MLVQKRNLHSLVVLRARRLGNLFGLLFLDLQLLQLSLLGLPRLQNLRADLVGLLPLLHALSTGNKYCAGYWQRNEMEETMISMDRETKTKTQGDKQRNRLRDKNNEKNRTFLFCSFRRLSISANFCVWSCQLNIRRNYINHTVRSRAK